MMNNKNIIKESAGVSFIVREWADIIFQLLKELDPSEPRLIVDGQDYPKQFQEFSVDYFVIDFNDWTNGYLDETSGYDKDGNYVVHIMVLNQFRKQPYMLTILNHEVKHAYQDWQRRSKGYEGIFNTKEVKEVYTGDFIKIIKDKISVGNFFKDILKKYYLLTDLELNAFMENVYDRDVINDYKKMISQLTNFDALRATRYENPTLLEKDWKVLKSSNLPFLKKYNDYNSFLSASTKYFNKRSEEILRKINKLEYVHKDRGLTEQVACHEVAPKGHGEGGYMSNEEALSLIDRIAGDRNKIKDPKKLQMFDKTISDFRHDIKIADTNLDTVDTYLHKLRTLFNCFNLETPDNKPKDKVF